MFPRRSGVVSAVAIGLLMGVAPAFAVAVVSATATISSVPNGANFDYTLSLLNTGTPNSGTFWFAWTPPFPEYDFLTSNPISTSQPTGWIGAPSLGIPGYSIECYNNTGSPIAPTQTGTFLFTSSDTPTQLQGTVFGFFPVTESFVYEGAPEVGTPA